MRISFNCPICGKLFSVDAAMAGKRARCSGCRNVVDIPGGTEAAPAAPSLPPLPPAPRLHTPAPPIPEPQYFSPAPEVAASAPSKPPLLLWGGIAGGAVVFVIVLVIVYKVTSRPNRPASPVAAVSATDNSGYAPSGAPAQNPGAAPSPVALPDRPPLRELEPGIQHCEIALSGPGPGQSMKLWLYLPAGKHAPRTLPCVLVAPAGSPMIIGMGLGDGDRAEHLPYVRAGFAVMAYELDGGLPGGQENATERQVYAACQKFLAAEGGRANARVAIDYLLAKVPEVDPVQIYAAGHSSAATVALQLAAHELRVKAAVAYAPGTDIAGHIGAEDLTQLEQAVPGIEDFARSQSPINLAPRCDVFLFYAQDDSVVSPSEPQAYAGRYGNRVTVKAVATGDHYDSMINEGIPAAIEWMKANGAKPAKR